MTRKQREQRTGTAELPDLWHFGEGGTLGARNVGANLYDIAAQVDEPARQACERLGLEAGRRR